METVVLSIHIFLAVCLVILVLLQQGKGADMGAVMGSGGANSLFGVSGASNVLVKMTTTVAVAFMFTSVLLVRFAADRAGTGGPVDDPLRGSSLSGVAAAVPSPEPVASAAASVVPAAPVAEVVQPTSAIAPAAASAVASAVAAPSKGSKADKK